MGDANLLTFFLPPPSKAGRAWCNLMGFDKLKKLPPRIEVTQHYSQILELRAYTRQLALLGGGPVHFGQNVRLLYSSYGHENMVCLS